MIPSLEGLPTKAKEVPSAHEVRLALLDTNPVFHSLGISSSDADELIDLLDSDMSEMLKWGHFVFLLVGFYTTYLYIDFDDNFLY